jgi:hypothetical protein
MVSFELGFETGLETWFRAGLGPIYHAVSHLCAPRSCRTKQVSITLGG